jgi:hypothetical protein
MPAQPAVHQHMSTVSEPPSTAPRRRNGWTAERRARQSAAIRRWCPWNRSTGPRTKAGKTVSSLNACRHGGRSAGIRAFKAVIALARSMRLAILRYSRLQQAAARETIQILTDELLEKMKIDLYQWLNLQRQLMLEQLAVYQTLTKGYRPSIGYFHFR